MLKRTPFARKTFERQPRMFGRIARLCFSGASSMREPVGKTNPIQSEAYLNVVRSLKCYRCAHPPRSVFCHRDETKGMGLKTDCREGWPGCPPCHWYVGTSGQLGKEGRRAFELEAGKATRAEVRALGLWPKRLPEWIE